MTTRRSQTNQSDYLPKRRMTFLRALLTIGALTLTGCNAGSPSGDGTSSAMPTGETSPSQSADGLTPVTIGYFPLVHTSTIVNAEEQGYLEDNGIDADFVQTQGGATVIPALVSGEVDIAYSNYTSALLAAQQGLPVTIIAGNDIGADDHGIYVDPESGIESIEDLEGKTFAVNNLQNIGTVAIYAQAEEVGLTRDDLRIVEMPYPDMAAAVENGNVDAIWQVEPFQVVAEDAGLVKIGNLFEGPVADMPVAGWITTREYADSHPEVIDGLREALSTSIDDLQNNRERLAALVPTFTKVSEATVNAIELPKFSSEVDVAQLQKGADLMLEYSLIDKELDVEGTVRTN